MARLGKAKLWIAPETSDAVARIANIWSNSKGYFGRPGEYIGYVRNGFVSNMPERVVRDMARAAGVQRGELTLYGTDVSDEYPITELSNVEQCVEQSPNR